MSLLLSHTLQRVFFAFSEAAPEPFLSDPAGDVYMGGTIPLVNNAAPAMVLLVGGFPNALLLPRQTL